MQLDEDLSDLNEGADDDAVTLPKTAQAPMAARRTLENLLERRALARRLRDDLNDDNAADSLEW